MLRAALLAGFVPVAASCTSDPPPPPPPDPLAELAAKARADAALATASVPLLGAAAEEVARVRTEHAVALQKEVDRERPPVGSSTPVRPETSAPAVPSAEAARSGLVAGLTAAEGRIGELIGAVPRYRAGLLGSVSAGCATLREVVLA